jgi:hypothetical protein
LTETLADERYSNRIEFGTRLRVQITTVVGIDTSLFNDTVVQVHFVFNSILYSALLACLALYNRLKMNVATMVPGFYTKIFAFQFALYGLVIFQSVHMFDHIVKYVQYYTLGIANPKGLFGQFANQSNVGIHIVVNGIIYVGLICSSGTFCQDEEKFVGILEPNCSVEYLVSTYFSLFNMEKVR